VLEQMYGLQPIIDGEHPIAYSLSEDIVAFFNEEGSCNIRVRHLEFCDSIKKFGYLLTDFCTIKYAHEFQQLMWLIDKNKQIMV